MKNVTNVATASMAGLGHALASVVDCLRRSTVEVFDTLRGGGCGVVWSCDGLILTNAHVVRSPNPIVGLSGDQRLRARVIARNEQRDLAALRICAENLVPVALRDIATLRPGELAIAVGSPWGLSGAAAFGVIHAVGSYGALPGNWVQADVRLAPGNSGGPLADAEGRVVGINSMVVGGLALAVPTDDIVHFAARASCDRREAA